MKKLFSLFSMFAAVIVHAQPGQPLLSLINAEKSFAKTAVDKSTKEAFVAFLSDSAIIFRPGPVLGKKIWEDRANSNDLLQWYPAFADIAASGELGYTTGPSQYRGDRKDTAAAVVGYFVSVWKKAGGNWKVALDIGISHERPAEPETPSFPAQKTMKGISPDINAAKTGLWKAEQDFIAAQDLNYEMALGTWLSPEARLYRAGKRPFTTEGQRKAELTQKEKKYSSNILSGNIALSGDLGYIYGSTTVASKQDGTDKLSHATYVRIWKKDETGEWKIVLDLLGEAR